MYFEDKLQVAEVLDAMGVDIIEAGFPIASEGDFEAVSANAERTKNAVIAWASPAPSKAISRVAAKLFGKARETPHTHLRIDLAHSFATSDEQKRRAGAWRSSRGPLVKRATSSMMSNGRRWMRRAPRLITSVVASRRAIKAGATTINLPDTVGYALPAEYEAMFRAVRERVPGADQSDFLRPLP